MSFFILNNAGALKLSGAVQTTITVANEAADTSCYPLFATAAAGNLGPKTNAGLTFNSATGLLTTIGLTATGTITSSVSVALTGTTNNLGTITTGTWNAGAVTSSGTISSATNIKAGAVAAAQATFDGNSINARTNSVASTLYLNDSGGAVQVGGVLTVNGFGTHTFSAGGTGAQKLQITNTTAGTGNYSVLALGTDAGASTGFLAAFSSTYTTSGPYVASGVMLDSGYAGGISILAEHASGAIRFYSGGTTLRWTMGTDGVFTSSVTNGLVVPMTATTGTATVLDGSNVIRTLTSSARDKEHLASWVVSADALARFVTLSPKLWDYKGQKSGAAGFISEDLEGLGILNAYGTSPLINYNKDGLPESNRDYALIGLQHLVLQNHESRIRALEARPT